MSFDNNLEDETRTFVGTRVFEKDDLPPFEEQSSLLRQEQVRTLYNIREVRLAIGINEFRDV